MVADSDRTVLELLQIRLDVAGYRSCAARTGQAALDIMKNSRPAALVLDLQLPDMDGFEVLEALAPRGGGVTFPILVIGKRLGAEDVQRAVRLGARDCMAKPFSGADVLERISRLLHRPSQPAPSSRTVLV